MTKARTLYDKIWDDHLVDQQPDGTCLLYIDRHLVHEVTSPQAFEGLRTSGRKVRAPEKTLAVVDHNIPTSDRNLPNPDPESAEQIRVMAENAHDFGIEYFDERDRRQGIVHVPLERRQHVLGHHVDERPPLIARRHDVIDRRDRPVRKPHLPPARPQHVEGLRGRDLVDQVQPDEQLRLAVGQFPDGVGVPDFLEKGGGHCFDGTTGGGGWALFSRLAVGG